MALTTRQPSRSFSPLGRKSPNPWSGRPLWNRSWKSCLAVGKRWRRFSPAVPCRAPGKRSNRWSTYFQDTTLACEPGALALLLQDHQDFLQSLAHFLQAVVAALLRKRQSGLLRGRFAFALKLLARSCDRETFFVEELLDAKNVFHVALTVHALSSRAFYRLQLRKLRLPETQHVGGKLTEFRHFTNAEVQLVGNNRLRF